tara:strand:+ start:20 stop:1006 length:987 start_codon:yes stop_codon:yes gene_type:complete
MSNTATMMGLGSGAGGVKIADAFSTTLYTGTGAEQTISNGLDINSEGGLVWIKSRAYAANVATDTERGAGKVMYFNDNTSQLTNTNGVKAFTSTGFTVEGNSSFNNQSSVNYASWNFRKSPKFFDVVSWIGDSTSDRKIPHSLDSEVGTIFVKSTTENYQWVVYSKNYGGGYYSWFPTAHKFYTSASNWNNTDATSTEFTIGSNGNVNLNTAGYVAYVFAESDLMKTGLIVGDGTSDREISLGFKPQWLMLVRVDVESSTWTIFDSKRGINSGAADPYLFMTSADAEGTDQQYVETTADGFKVGLVSSGNYYNKSGQTNMYIAIKAED